MSTVLFPIGSKFAIISVIRKVVNTINKIKELRVQKKMTLKDLAKDLRDKKIFKKITDGTLSRYEGESRDPKFETWQKLADYFDVDISYLKGETNYKDANDLINKVSSIENSEEKIKFIKSLNSKDIRLIASANSQKIDSPDTLKTIIKILLTDTSKYSKQFANILEVIDKDIYSRTLTKLAQRDDDIDEDEEINITYKNELELVYYLNLVQDNLSTIKRDKVTDAISALKAVLNDDAITVSAELSTYLKKVRDYD